MSPADPKRTVARIVDPAAVAQAKLMYPWCAACGVGQWAGLNGHHFLPKDRGGDDVVANIVCLCGSGTSRCHGAHHGNPYVVDHDDGAQRRDAAWVNSRAGAHVAAHRPDIVAYVLEKLGRDPGADWLERTYQLVLR